MVKNETMAFKNDKNHILTNDFHLKLYLVSLKLFKMRRGSLIRYAASLFQEF